MFSSDEKVKNRDSYPNQIYSNFILMIYLLDFILVTFHLIIIIFNLCGWAWEKTRRIHFWVISLTAFSWFILGIWKGWGYCFLTDWSWEVKEILGEKDLPNSFIQYIVEKAGISIHAASTDIVTGACFAACFILSLYFNFLHKKVYKSGIKIR
jgi:hypothetical protein